MDRATFEGEFLKLAALHKRGALSDAEFAERRASLLQQAKLPNSVELKANAGGGQSVADVPTSAAAEGISNTSNPVSTKACPLCGEEILAVAKKCKHCGSMLDGSDQGPREVLVVDPLDHALKNVKGRLSFIGHIGVGVGVLMMALIPLSRSVEGSVMLFLFGTVFIVFSYFGARKK